jgi:hypothetical protein
MVCSLSASARQPNLHSETSSLDAPICEDWQRLEGKIDFGRNVQPEAM